MKKLAFLLPCLTIALLSACAEKHDAAAIVNGTDITILTYESTLQNLAAPYQRTDQPNVLDNPQNRQLLGRVALEQLITNEVLAQQAQKQNIKIDDAQVTQLIEQLKQGVAGTDNGKPVTDKKIINKKFQEKLKQDGISLEQLKSNIRKELQVKALLNEFSSQQQIQLQEQDIQQFYNNVIVLLGKDQKKKEALPKDALPLLVPFAQQVQKQTAERALVSAVFLATPNDISKKDLATKQQKARDIITELNGNKISFAEAIATYSDDKNALKTNGEQLVLRGTLPASLDKTIFESELGVIIGPLTQPEGIYIVRVNEKRAATTPTYSQLRQSIIKNLAEIQSQNNLRQYVKELVNNAKVEILLPEFKPQESSETQK